MKHLAELLGVKHHVTTAYCPWANGAVERVNRTLLHCLRALRSELGKAATDWDVLLPAVQYILNHMITESLGGRTPIEVIMGYKPQQPLDMAMWSGVTLTDAKQIDLVFDRIATIAKDLATALHEMHGSMCTRRAQRWRKRDSKRSRNAPLPKMNIGDLVMVARHSRAAHKVTFRWNGPYQVVGTVNPFVYQVKMIGVDKKPKAVHVQRLKRFSANDIGHDAELRQIAQQDLGTFTVKSLEGWRIGPSRNIELRVFWEGFEERDSTWEDAVKLHEDIPSEVSKYLRENKAIPELSELRESLMTKQG